MTRLKKFWIIFLSFLPLTAGAFAPLAVGAIVGVTAIIGQSIYRSISTVDMSSALSFFSACWSCDMFSSIMAVMSGILPGVYHSIGLVVMPFAVALTAIWFAWRIFSKYMNGDGFDSNREVATFGKHLIKLALVLGLLAVPLPRMINDIAIRPVFNLGLSVSRIMDNDNKFSECVIATTLSDPTSATAMASSRGAYSPIMRHELACEVANIHQVTGLGMTIGWTLLNMAFDQEYMHKFLWFIPIFPNVPLVICGAAIMWLFFMALIPIPVYFLEMFIKLSMDLIMLPLMLFSWLFKGWKILPDGGRTIKRIIDDIISGTLGIAACSVLMSLALMFLNAAFGTWNGASVLEEALAKNDSKFLMDGIMMNNDGIVTVFLMGVFIAMFMTMIPALSKTFFNVGISQEYYNTTKNNLDTLWKGLKKGYSTLKE